MAETTSTKPWDGAAEARRSSPDGISEPGTPAEIARHVIEAAVWSPSIHNTQPWQFASRPGEISLYADAERRLAVADPAGREMMISCGAALFTVRLALRFLGYVPDVTVLPDPDRPMLVARVSWPDRVPAAGYEQDLYRQITLRRTHRGGFSGQPLPPALIDSLLRDSARGDAKLHLMPDDLSRAAIAATVEAGECIIRLDTARAQEVARRGLPPGSARRDGVPDSAYPAQPDVTEPRFPARDFAHGQGWGHIATGQPQVLSAGVLALLATPGDQPADWIGAGQALQHLLLSASVSGAAVALHSQPLEIPQLRDLIRAQFSGGGYPQMILRLGSTGQTAASIRRSVEDVLL